MYFSLNDFCIKETNAEIKKKHKKDLIIREGEISNYFYYLLSGEVDVYNITTEGKEFIQHKVLENSFFGEPAVLLEKPFPGTAEVHSEKAEIIKVNREKFLNFLQKYPEKCIEFTMSIAEKCLSKSNSLRNIVFLNPEERITKHLNGYKKQEGGKKICIPLTRRELSSMTGLCIETTIRTIKKMEKEKKLEIRRGKIYY